MNPETKTIAARIIILVGTAQPQEAARLIDETEDPVSLIIALAALNVSQAQELHGDGWLDVMRMTANLTELGGIAGIIPDSPEGIEE